MSSLQKFSAALVLLSLAVLPRTAPAQGEGSVPPPVTYEKVLEYLRLEVKEEKILRLVRSSPVTFTLGQGQVEELRKAGASDQLLEAMRKPGQVAAKGSDVGAFVVILDCSGSMKEAVAGGGNKWEAARKAALDLVASIPDGRKLAVIVYGHDASRACEAVSILRPLDGIDAAGKADLRRAVMALQPVGHTPIARSLRAAGGELAKCRELAKLVLITDGMESCHGDPAKEASQLAAAYPNLVGGVEVVGFAVEGEEQKAVSQIASAGRGKYYDADSAAQLAESVKVIERQIVQGDAATPGPAPKSPRPGVAVIKGHTAAVHAVAFSPDGRTFATGSDDKTIRIWDVATGDRKERIPHSHEVYCLAFSPDGKLLAAGGADKAVTLWDAASGEKVRTIPEASSGAVALVAFSPDGRTLASVGHRKETPTLWDATTGKQKALLEGHKDTVGQITFSPDGRTVATVSDDSTVRLWDAAGGKEKDSFRAHHGEVYCLSFSPDGKRLATGGEDKTVVVWDTRKGNVVKPVLEGHGRSVVFVGWTADGRVVSQTFGGGTRVWNPTAGKAALARKDWEGRVFLVGRSYEGYIALSPDGRVMAFAEPESPNDVQLLDLSEHLDGPK